MRTVSAVVNPSRLREEMTRRGWDAMHLAHQARLSPATISAALAGRPIAARSLARIADALLQAPVLDIIDLLIMHEKRERELG
jgi:transcriptional regulator with XRE-family HTH domain